jgi:hypothetical protein
MFNKDDLFNSYTLATGTVEVENWGGEVTVQEIDANTIDKMRKLGEGKELQAACTVIVAGVINEDGKRVFNTKDIDRLMKMSVNDLNKVSEAILKLSGIGGDSDDEASDSEGE